MEYYKIVSGVYITAYGVGNAGSPITGTEYEKIVNAVKATPVAPEGSVYRLRADTLEWELVELPPMPEPEPTAEDKAEAFNILMGVIS